MPASLWALRNLRDLQPHLRPHFRPPTFTSDLTSNLRPQLRLQLSTTLQMQRHNSRLDKKEACKLRSFCSNLKNQESRANLKAETRKSSFGAKLASRAKLEAVVLIGSKLGSKVVFCAKLASRAKLEAAVLIGSKLGSEAVLARKLQVRSKLGTSSSDWKQRRTANLEAKKLCKTCKQRRNSSKVEKAKQFRRKNLQVEEPRSKDAHVSSVFRVLRC